MKRIKDIVVAGQVLLITPLILIHFVSGTLVGLITGERDDRR
jgi:hypothetical protein